MQGKEIHILVKVIWKAFFCEDFEQITETLEYDYQMSDLKKVEILSTDDKLMHYNWIADHVVEIKEWAKYVNGAVLYKHTELYCQGLVVDDLARLKIAVKGLRLRHQYGVC